LFKVQSFYELIMKLGRVERQLLGFIFNQ